MVKFSIKYSYDFETKQYIAEIPELHLSDFGDTIDEAFDNVKKALELYLEDVTKVNLHTQEVQYA
jgi:predicted RNase H-like HicB family nuclease